MQLILEHCHQNHLMQIQCGNFHCNFQDFDWEVKLHERIHANTHDQKKHQSMISQKNSESLNVKNCH